MRNSSTVADFFKNPDAIVNAIPYEPVDSRTLNPLVSSYLDHYRLNTQMERFVKTHEIWQSEINQHRIVEQRWLGSDSRQQTLLIVHGYFDHSALYGKLIRWGLTQGFDIHCFDLPGHGLSSGEPAAIDSFDRYSEVLSSIIERERYPQHHLMGQSTGGAVIINYLLNADLQPTPAQTPEKVVLLAPLVRSRHWQLMRWLYLVLHHVLGSIKRGFVRSSHDEDFMRFLKDQDPLQSDRIPLIWLGAMDAWVHKIKKFPTRDNLEPLILQGTKDTTVDWRYNLKEIQRCIPNARIEYVENAMHHMVNESDEYWLPIVRRLEKHFKLCD